MACTNHTTKARGESMNTKTEQRKEIMLNIISSNRVELLLKELANNISTHPLSSPILPEVVVVPSPAMARWINQQVASQRGVAANFAYPLSASFVWQLARKLLPGLPDSDPLSLDIMVWKVFEALPGMLPMPAFEPLRHYLRQDANGLKRWQLANRIADVFDRYQYYRPKLIRDWGNGEGVDWQPDLWRHLASGVKQHRVAMIDQLLEFLRKSESVPNLPERVSFFAVSSLPPLFAETICALAAHTQVCLYLHAPTDAYWADLVTQKELARKRLSKPEVADLWEVGNSLLSSWGRQGQALQDLLLECDMHPREPDCFDKPSDVTLLDRLHQDIFTLRPNSETGVRVEVKKDDSIQVHICHSAMRECQVLHDQLLAMLDARKPDLRPEDILVMVPEISFYAPYIESVFNHASQQDRPFIPWNLSDISVKDEHPLIRVFLRLMDLPNSRFSQSEILSYLDVPELAGHFGLDNDAVVQVKTWLAQANLRWGLDAKHKEKWLGLPGTGTEENTWAQAEKRLFGGYALGECGWFEGCEGSVSIAPIGSVEGTAAEVLGKFWCLLSMLRETAEQLENPRSIVDWRNDIATLIIDFFGEGSDADGRLQKIRDAMSDLADQAGELTEKISLTLVRKWLAQHLETVSQYGRHFSGGVTFCGMRPMRSLPFKVICVLGLQDLAFPRREHRAEFDLMRNDWHPGDPRKGDEDRYLFLETLLCARQCLYLSYVGRDIRQNTQRQPSVLVRELLDYIDQQYSVTGGVGKLSEQLTHVHPLHPFSLRNYDNSGQGSYDKYWCQVAKAMQQRQNSQNAVAPLDWPVERLPPPPQRMREVTITQLEQFVRHPVRYFVNNRLQVYLREESVEEDDERFTLDGLQSFFIKQQLVEDQFKGSSRPLRRQLSAEGKLPHGAFAELVFDDQSNKVSPLLGRLHPYLYLKPQQFPVDLRCDGDNGSIHLTGQIKGFYAGLGLLRWRPSKLKGVDIFDLWLAHLACCASGLACCVGGDETGKLGSVLHTEDHSFVILTALTPDEAKLALCRYLTWYWEGIRRPLLVLPKASYAYQNSILNPTKKKSEPLEAAKKAAQSEWDGNSYCDKDDPYIQLVMRCVSGDPLNSKDFIKFAGQFYDQVLRMGKLL
ncbi:RecBCD enzyme subunit RecC [Gammaproteobacteria bacterium]